jgi:hypothetical protein
MAFEQFYDQVDGLAGKLRLISLNVDNNFDLAQFGRDFGNPVGSAGTLRTGQKHLAAEISHNAGDFFTIGRDTDSARFRGPRGCFVGMLNQGLARFA